MEARMGSKDKGGAKSSKTAPSKTLKEKRAAKKGKAAASTLASMQWTPNQG
jgi:hypothetical protein